MRIEDKPEFIRNVAKAIVVAGVTTTAWVGDFRDYNDPLETQIPEIMQTKQDLAESMWQDGLFARRGLIVVDRRFLDDPRHNQLDLLDKQSDELVHEYVVKHPIRSRVINFSWIIAGLGIPLSLIAINNILKGISWRRRGSDEFLQPTPR